jgi:hypothetical protein
VTSLASVEDLVAYMSNIQLEAEQYQAAELVLDGVEAEVEAFIGRPLVSGPQAETAYMSDNGTGFVRLAGTPVISVESVSILGQTLNTSSYQIGPGGIFLIMPYINTPALFITSYGPSGITAPADPTGVPIIVNYTGGLPAAAARQLRLEILRIAANEMQNRHDDVLGVSGEGRTSPPPLLPVGLDDNARERLSRFKRRVAI